MAEFQLGEVERGGPVDRVDREIQGPAQLLGERRQFAGAGTR